MQRILMALAFCGSLVSAWTNFGGRRTQNALRALSISQNLAMSIEKSNFLNLQIAKKIVDSYETPLFVYDEDTLRSQAEKTLSFPNPFGLTVRYAMKASPNAAILKIFSSMGLHIDASSGYEVQRAMRAGIPASHISLSSQEFPKNFKEIYDLGIEFNACSLHQLESFGKLFPGGKCGLRFNPGKGSGGTGKTNVGGPSASFGIWHELKPQVKEIVAKYNIQVTRIHTHIGSGSDPSIWQNVAGMSLDLVKEFPEVKTLNLGGGYKVGRMSYETSTDITSVGVPVKTAFEEFAKSTGRELHLEIEPGTFLTANSGTLLCTAQDVVRTCSREEGGYTFIKVDSGMTEVLRPSLYGAQHPIVVLTDEDTEPDYESYVVVGHCCESGDLFTSKPGVPEELQERLLQKVKIGDLISIEGSGGYCSSMNTKNYNSFPEACEVMITKEKEITLIRRRQTLDQILENEV